MNYYELLQVRQKANNAEIELAYKKALTIYHPDKYAGNSKFAEDMIRSLNVAFSILSDADKRNDYDGWLELQTEELIKSRASRSKSKKTSALIFEFKDAFRSLFNGLNAFIGKNKSLTLIVCLALAILASSPIKNSINGIFIQGLMGSGDQFSKKSNVNIPPKCIPKRIIADANGDSVFSYSDLPQLALNFYQNTGKFISRELAVSKIGIFFEIRTNSCGSVSVTILSTLVWIFLGGAIFFLLHLLLELTRAIFRAAFFHGLNQAPSSVLTQRIYFWALPKKFNLSWIRFIAFICIAMGIFSYFKFLNGGSSQNGIEARPKNFPKTDVPIPYGRAPSAGKNQGQTSDYYFLALNLVNEVRAKGVECGGKYFPSTSPLRLNDALISAARIHATNMADFFF